MPDMHKRRTISLDLRERIVAAYDGGEGTREDVARRFRVSLGMVKKLLQQRRHTGSIAARHPLAGRKPRIVHAHQRQLRTLLGQKPDLTLKELRGALGLECSLQAIHVVLGKMGLTYKKRVSGRPNKTGPTLRRRAGAGAGGKAGSTPRGWSSTPTLPKCSLRACGPAIWSSWTTWPRTRANQPSS
jgi:transposase